MIRAISILIEACLAFRRSVVALALGVVPLCLMACTSAPRVTVTPLATRPLSDMPGKDGEMILVEYGPGASDPVRRDNAQAFVYVIEGSVVMQVRGGDEVTLTPGQTFYEGPDDVHIVGRNASSAKPAKFVVFLVKDGGAPLFVPEK